MLTSTIKHDTQIIVITKEQKNGATHIAVNNPANQACLPAGRDQIFKKIKSSSVQGTCYCDLPTGRQGETRKPTRSGRRHG